MTPLICIVVGALLTLLMINHAERDMQTLTCPFCEFQVAHDAESADDARQLMREHDCDSEPPW